MISAQQVTSASEMLANYAAIRRRLYANREVALVKRSVLCRAKEFFYQFDAHVLTRALHLQAKAERELQAQREIERMEKKRQALMEAETAEIIIKESEIFVSPQVQEVIATFGVDFNEVKSRSPRARATFAATVASYAYDVPLNSVFSERRHKRVSLARQSAIHITAQLTTWSMPKIGKFFGRDHTTVLHAIRRENERLGCDIGRANLRAAP